MTSEGGRWLENGEVLHKRARKIWRNFFDDAALSIERRKQKTAEAALLLPLSCLIGERSARSEGTLVTYHSPPPPTL